MNVKHNEDLELFASAAGSPVAAAHGCTCSATDGVEDTPKLDCPVHGLERLTKAMEGVVVEVHEVVPDRHQSQTDSAGK
jgi:hypothetical protein